VYRVSMCSFSGTSLSVVGLHKKPMGWLIPKAVHGKSRSMTIEKTWPWKWIDIGFFKDTDPKSTYNRYVNLRRSRYYCARKRVEALI
jgi:hypothetical protein